MRCALCDLRFAFCAVWSMRPEPRVQGFTTSDAHHRLGLAQLPLLISIIEYSVGG